MNDEILKLTNVLADPTRFSIYSYIVDTNKPVNVQEIANMFNIHPNVARLHLTKLKDINLLLSEKEKNGKGGRPSQIYVLSDEEVSLNFPSRNYKLLSSIAISALERIGEKGRSVFDEEGRNYGIDLARKAILHNNMEDIDKIPIDQKLEIIKEIFLSQGLIPSLEIVDENTIMFQLRNCIFKNKKQQKGEEEGAICEMHCNLFRGIFETFLGEIDFMKESSIKTGAPFCNYYVILLPIK